MWQESTVLTFREVCDRTASKMYYKNMSKTGVDYIISGSPTHQRYSKEIWKCCRIWSSANIDRWKVFSSSGGVYRVGVWRPDEIFPGVWRLQNWKHPRLQASLRRRLASKGNISPHLASTELGASASVSPRNLFGKSMQTLCHSN